MLWTRLRPSPLLLLFCSLIGDFLKFTLNNTLLTIWRKFCIILRLKMKAAPSRTCPARRRRRRSLHLLQPSLLIVSQVTAACEWGWGAWMTSSASGAGGVGTDVPNYLGRKEKKKSKGRKKKKKTQPEEPHYVPRFSVWNLFRGSGMWNVQWRLWIPISRKVARSRRGPVGCGRGPVGEKSCVRPEFLWQISGNMSEMGTSGREGSWSGGWAH